jgi:hypothetical protein
MNGKERFDPAQTSSAIDAAVLEAYSDDDILTVSMDALSAQANLLLADLQSKGYSVSILDIDFALERRRHALALKKELSPAAETHIDELITLPPYCEYIDPIVAQVLSYTDKADAYQIPRLYSHLLDVCEKMAVWVTRRDQSLQPDIVKFRIFQKIKDHFQLP